MDGHAPAPPRASDCRSTATRPGPAAPAPASPRRTAGPASWASGARPTPASRPGPTACATPSTCCTSTASTTASAPSTTPRSSHGSSPRASRSTCASAPTSSTSSPTRPRHPFPALHAAGVPLTINTDDPGYLGIDLTGEFVKVAGLMGWGLADLRRREPPRRRRRVLPARRKAALHDRIDAFLVRGPDRPWARDRPPRLHHRSDVTMTFQPFRPLAPFAPPAAEQHWLDTADELAAERSPPRRPPTTRRPRSPSPTSLALHEAGLDMAVVPRRFGGAGMSPVTFGNVLGHDRQGLPVDGVHLADARGRVGRADRHERAGDVGVLPRRAAGRQALRQRAQRADVGQPVPHAAAAGRADRGRVRRCRAPSGSSRAARSPTTSSSTRSSTASRASSASIATRRSRSSRSGTRSACGRRAAS